MSGSWDAMVAATTDIYSPENIARSRARAAGIRAGVERSELDPEWLNTADEVEAYADEREAANPLNGS